MPQRNLNRIISEAAKRLTAVGIDSGEAEAEIILCDLLNVDRLTLYLKGNELIDDALLDRFETVIRKRETRYPLQYILGSAWFFGRKFLVNESVMAPTPETEILLDSVLRAARHCRSDPVTLIDVGVGSGVVAVSAKLENPALDVTAVDISSDALEVAKVNAERLGASIRLLQSDLFSALGENDTFDIIASNPPYIPDHEYPELPPEVKADPKQALLGGEKGLDVIERLIAESPDHLRRPGFLLFEIGYDQADDIMKIVMDNTRYSGIALLKDLNDIDRVVICKIE